MDKKNQKQNNQTEDNNNTPNNNIKRRTLLKALAGVPVLGAFAYELSKKSAYDLEQKSRVIKELGLEDLNTPKISVKTQPGNKGDLLRIGIIGFGARAVAHANGLGYMHPDDVVEKKAKNTLQDWLLQEDLNVEVTGICDVFDLHAQTGMETIQNGLRPNGVKSGSQVKRYRTYREMLDDKNIDAIMIATPDHHHAPIAIEAAKAGKHIYCEKSIALYEEELNELYNTVKNSDIVFQLGHQITQSVTFQQAKEVVRRGILGKITLIETTTNRNSAHGAWIRHTDANGNPKPGNEKTIDWNQWLGNTPKVPFSVDRFYNWQKWFAYETGVIGQLFTHEFDAVNQLLHIGIPKSVSSSGGIYYWKDNREMPDLLHCVFEYPQKDLTLLYSASLASSLNRGRVFMGHDASMELGSSVNITVDSESTKYKKQIQEGIIDPSSPMLSFNPGSNNIDAVTSATEKYYAARGLTTTKVNGHEVDLTYLHIKEWIDCIRNGNTPSASIDKGFEEGIACIMAHRSYLEKRTMFWDDVKKKIV